MKEENSRSLTIDEILSRIDEYRKLRDENPDIAAETSDGGIIDAERYEIWQKIASLNGLEQMLERMTNNSG